ncbi:MAG: hypothetical protein K9N53_08005 [Candidatus Marinimicrobia bacterium]|nr:hypothetical protein [Candidatus Neomarinimicrobiota bacterium]MCF7828902.1 hypothetical protein [Candidatus Neomarinimicrobiota bacterium]
MNKTSMPKKNFFIRNQTLVVLLVGLWCAVNSLPLSAQVQDTMAKSSTGTSDTVRLKTESSLFFHGIDWFVSRQDIKKGWIRLVFALEPEEPADTSAFHIYEYTNAAQMDRFYRLHSLHTGRDYYLHVAPKGPPYTVTVMRRLTPLTIPLNDAIDWMEADSITDSILKYASPPGSY